MIGTALLLPELLSDIVRLLGVKALGTDFVQQLGRIG